MKKLITILCFVFSGLLFTACEDDVEIETGEATNITMRSASVSCRIVSSEVNFRVRTVACCTANRKELLKMGLDLRQKAMISTEKRFRQH